MVVSADAIYAQDYGALVEEHMAADAAVTMVTTEVEPDDAGRYGVVQVDGGKVVDYAYKPDDPAGQPGGQRGLRVPAGAAAGHARGSSPTRRRGRARGPRPRAPAAAGGGRRRARGALRGLLARRRDGRRVLGEPHGPAGRAAADRPRRPGLADPDPRGAAARLRPRVRGAAIEDSLVAPGRAGGGLAVAVGRRPRRGRRGGRGRARVGAAAGRRRARRARAWCARCSTTASRSGATQPWARTAARSRSSGCGRR